MGRTRHVRGVRGLPAALVVVVGLLVGLGACGDDGGPDASVELSEAGKRGQTTASDAGCTACHTADGGRSTGPTWKDLAGSEVELDGGETLTADDDYLTRAIVDPRSQVVAGYANIMPTYGDRLDDDEVADIVAYLRDLSTHTRR